MHFFQLHGRPNILILVSCGDLVGEHGELRIGAFELPNSRGIWSLESIDLIELNARMSGVLPENG